MIGIGAVLASIPEGACACGAEGHMASIGPPALGAKGCVRSAQGGRRLAVRTAMDHPIGALPRTPFPASRDFPSRGNEKIGGTGYYVTYDIESQSRNADFISIALRAIRNPQRRSRCRPLNEANTTLLHNPRRQPRPFFKNCGEAATTTLGPKGRQT